MNTGKREDPIYETACDNIRKLLKEKGIAQKELSTHLKRYEGISKELSPQYSARFTLTELCKIADYLGVSLDTLLNREEKAEEKVITNYDLCTMIPDLIEHGLIKATTITVEEESTILAYENVEYEYRGSSYYEKEPYIKDELLKNKYYAFYFSNYWTPSTEEEKAEADQCGNQLGKNIELNKAIELYFHMLPLIEDRTFNHDELIELMKKCIKFEDTYYTNKTPKETDDIDLLF